MMLPKAKWTVVPDSIQEKIIDFVMHRGLTKAEVAKQFDYKYTTVDSIICKYEATGETVAQWKKGGAFCRSKFSKEHEEIMLCYVADHPSATLLEIKAHLREQSGLELSVTSMQTCLCERLHITLKRTIVEHD